jgi:hypothetical protein
MDTRYLSMMVLKSNGIFQALYAEFKFDTKVFPQSAKN